MLDKLSLLISDIECRVPNPDRTFAEVLEFLRELQRLRAALPKTADGVTVVPGMQIIANGKIGGQFSTLVEFEYCPDADVIGECFFTVEAAERARGKA